MIVVERFIRKKTVFWRENFMIKTSAGVIISFQKTYSIPMSNNIGILVFFYFKVTTGEWKE